MADNGIGVNFNQLIQSLSGLGSTSSNLADITLTGRSSRVIPTVDYSQFHKHVYFSSAVRKFNASIGKIQNTYPIGLCGSNISSLCADNVFQVDKWKKEASGFDLYLLNQLSLTGTITAAATNNAGETVVLDHVVRDSTNVITGSQTAIVNSISARAINFETYGIDVINQSSGSANDHIDYPATAELFVSRGPNLKNMLPEILFLDDNNDVLERLLQAFGEMLDETKSYVDQMSNIKHFSYDDIDRVPDKFLPVLASHYGIKLFQSAVNSAIESYFISSTTGATNQEIMYDVWNRIINNIPYILKNKGTRECVESIMRIYGVNHNLLKLDEYSILKRNQNIKIKEEIDVPILFSTGDVYCQLPTGSNSALDFAASSNFTIEMRVSVTSLSDTILLKHPLYTIKLDTSGRANFVTTAGTSAIATHASISSFMSKPNNFINVTVSRHGNNIKVWQTALSGSGSGGDDIVIMTSGTTSGVVSINFDSSAGASAFGAYFPGSGSFSGYMHEIKIWNCPLHEEDIREHTRNFESISFINSTASNSATYGSLKAHYKLKENVVLTGGYNYIVDSTTAGNTATPVNFQSTKRYQVFSDVPAYTTWYPNALIADNDKIRQTDSTTDIEDTSNISLHMTPIRAINKDIRNVIQNIDIKELIGDPTELYEPSYSGPLTSAVSNVISSRYGRRLFQSNESGSGLSGHANSLFDIDLFIDAMDNFNDVLGGIFPFIKQFLPAKTSLLSEGILIEPYILERPKEERQEYKAVALSPTAYEITNHYLYVNATAASAATTATFQGFRYTDGKQLQINNGLSSFRNIATLSSKHGDSINYPIFADTKIGRIYPVSITPANPNETETSITLSRMLISPTASPSAYNGHIQGNIQLLRKGKQFITSTPALKFTFPVSADGTNLFKAVIGDVDAGKGRTIEGKDFEFVTNITSKNLKIQLQLADIIKSLSSDAQSLSGEIGIVNINITNLFNNTTSIMRIAIGNRQELFNELKGQGGIKVIS